MSNNEHTLEKIREQIDQLDQQLIELINQRAQLAIEIGKIKRNSDQSPQFYRPEREAQILKRIIKLNKGPIENKDIAYIFRVIMSIGLALQHPIKIAFLGPEGTFSHGAAIKHFGPSIGLAPTESISDVFRQVEFKQANYGVVPVENSTEGVVNLTLDELIDSSLKICGEIILPIHQHLLVKPDDSTSIQRIYSHPQSLAQCRIWLNQNYPQAEKIAVSSNAQAAKLAKEESGAAAVGGDMAAEQYNLVKKAENIEDSPENMTRFLIIGHQEVQPSGNDKTSLLIYISNIPGTLALISQPFAKHNVNITLPTLRHSRQKIWNYVFFIDIEGHQNDPPVKAALAELAQAPVMMRILGSYPKAIL